MLQKIFSFHHVGLRVKAWDVVGVDLFLNALEILVVVNELQNPVNRFIWNSSLLVWSSLYRSGDFNAGENFHVTCPEHFKEILWARGYDSFVDSNQMLRRKEITYLVEPLLVGFTRDMSERTSLPKKSDKHFSVSIGLVSWVGGTTSVSVAILDYF